MKRAVVVTGASSGIGRATALEFARQGDDVVLAARRGDALEEVARACRAAGVEALPVVTDVTREADVVALVEAALAWRGRIDVWVNNAGVTLFAPLEEGPFEAHRRVIETNLFGPMFAARAVVPVFRRQRRGVMINVGSVLSEVGHAFVPSYAISKFALRGLSEVLRVELAEEPDVHVCAVLPYAVDTQHFETGANAIGRAAYTMPPVQSPEEVARVIVEVADRPRRERLVPRVAALGLAFHWAFPETAEKLLLRALKEWHLGEAQPRSGGNLYHPADAPAATHGTRPPRIGTARFALWAAREIVKIQAEAAWRRVRLTASPRGARPR